MNPVAFYIRNHSSSELLKAELAKLPTLSTRPSFLDKTAYAAWCHDAGTFHVFYVLAEPENPALRSSGQNPIKFLHGLIADYDGSPELIKAELAKLKFDKGIAPTWVTTTFSGKARLLWAFERPVPVFTAELMTKFKAIMLRELRVDKLLPGLDTGAWENPHTPFELGTDWRQPWGDVRVPHTTVMTAIHDASAKAKWKVDGPEIPLEAVAAEVDRRWPGRWGGGFLEGAKGVRFWDPAADNPTGCTIRKTGVQAWTGESRFLPWPEILGADFVAKYRANRIGSAIGGCYFDGRDYWSRDEEGNWRAFNGPQMSRRLAVKHRLSSETRRGEASEVASALTAIEDCRAVDGAFPCLYLQDEVVRDGVRKYLNISRVRTLPTSEQRREWGEGFPWIAAYLDGLFEEKQRAIFLSWLAHFYNNARRGTPRKGHALFISGDVSAGKTFLSQFVIGGLMGGHEEASSYILGTTNFNEQLFSAPVWCIDDAVMAADAKRHGVYSQMVKKIVANPYQDYSPKFKKSVSFRFHGRLVVTMNNDANSVKILPNIEHSILDKLVILKAGKPGTSFKGAEVTVRQELPAFADFVSNWQIPDWLQTKPDQTTRFGHDAWAHEELIETANDSSASAGVRELLEMWRTAYFRRSNDTEWTGSCINLYSELQNTESTASVVKSVANHRNVLGTQMQNLISQGCDWITFHRSKKGRNYSIRRPEDLPLK